MTFCFREIIKIILDMKNNRFDTVKLSGALPGDVRGETFYGSLNLMMCGLRQMYPEGRIVFMTPLRRNGDRNRNAKGYALSRYVSAIQNRGNFLYDELFERPEE